MAGVRGNQAYFAWSKQTARDTPNTTYVKKAPFSGGSIAPVKNVEQLSETDANRDAGVSYVSSVGVEGNPELYVRDQSIDSLLEAVLGNTVTSGAAPNYTHTITAANTIPYLTACRNLGGGVLMEQFQDLLVSELTISADAGAPLTAAASLMGRKAARLAVEPASAASLSLQSGSVYNFNEAAVTLNSVSTALVSGFELTISNNVGVQQTDDVVPYDVNVGQREVTLGFQMIFDTIDEYARFHYGATAGTTQDATLANIPATFTFSKGASNEVSFSLQGISYEEFPIDPDPGGDPIVVDVRARAQRPVSGSILTAVVKNQKATPWTA